MAEKEIGGGEIELSEIAVKCETDISAVRCYLFGVGGHPKLGGGLTVRRRQGDSAWTMSATDAAEFVRRVGAYTAGNGGGQTARNAHARGN